MKRVSCLLLLVALCFTLCSCGSNSTEEVNTPVAENEPTEASKDESPKEVEPTEEPKINEESESTEEPQATEEPGSDTTSVKIGSKVKNDNTSFTISAFEIVKKYNLEYQEDAYFSRAASVEPYTSGMVLVLGTRNRRFNSFRSDHIGA